jgi:aminoglycoside phosphotransferase (APT) family kinase protein
LHQNRSAIVAANGMNTGSGARPDCRYNGGVKRGTPDAEVEIDVALVRRLLAAQHPDLAGLAIDEAASGFDNVMFRLGSRFAVRLPRRLAAAGLLLNEQRWLPELSARLSLPVPVPLRTGGPSAEYPWRWSVVPWLPGEPADLREPAADQAPRLAEFLRRLHHSAPDTAPRNPVRGGPLAERIAAHQARALRLRGAAEVDSRAVRDVWERAVAAPIDVDATWIHGDLHPHNVLVDAARFSAVIDWGDMAAGDPATDLASIWMLFRREPDRRTAMSHYGPASPATWARARGWAVLFGTLLADVGVADGTHYEALGARILRQVAEGP